MNPLEEKLNGQESIWAVIKNETREAALSTSIHGMCGIFKSKFLFIKITWILLFIASSSYCAYTIVLNVRGYLNFDVVTNIYTHLDIPAEFPQVTICNQNAITTKYGLDYARKVLEADFEQDHSFIKYLYLKYVVLFDAYNKYGSSGLDQFGLDLDDMILSCRFNDYICNSSDFVKTFNSYYGPCYGFNTGKYANGSSKQLSSVTQAGLITGLSMELFTGNPTDPFSLSFASGLHISINNQSVYSSIYDGFSLEQGTHTNIMITKSFNENLPQPYSECTDYEEISNSESELVQLILSTGYQYRFKDCIDMCYVKYLIDSCSCQDGSAITDFPNVPYCLNSTQKECYKKPYFEFYNQNVKNFCADLCPLECNQVDYTLFLNTLAYPTSSFYQTLKKNRVLQKNFDYNISAMTFDSVKNSVVSFFINYGDLSYIRIVKDPKMTLLDLISQIGGVCGLFVGMSFMSFFEIVELGIVILTLLIESFQAKLRIQQHVSKVANDQDG